MNSNSFEIVTNLAQNVRTSSGAGWSADLSFWADLLGILGFIITIGGFIAGLIQLTKIKKAAQAAQEAAIQTKESIGKIDCISSLVEATHILDELKHIHRNENFRVRLPDRYIAIRRLLTEARSSNDKLTQEHRLAIQGVIDQIKTIEQLVDKYLDTGKEFPKVQRLNEIVSDQSQIIHEVLLSFKNKI